MPARVDDENPAIGGDDLRLQQVRRRRAEAFGMGAEPAALDQAGDTHAGAAAALDVAPALGRHGVIGLDPAATGPEADRRRRRDGARAAQGDEGVVELDVPHRVGPDQQRIGSVGAAEIAVAAALHDDAQIVGAGEVDRSGHVGGRCGGDDVGAGRWGPGVEIARDLGSRRLILDEEGVFQQLHQGAALGALGRGLARRQHRDGARQPAADGAPEIGPLRFARPARVARPNPPSGRGSGRGAGRGAQNRHSGRRRQKLASQHRPDPPRCGKTPLLRTVNTPAQQS
jgi:hypothetical protein